MDGMKLTIALLIISFFGGFLFGINWMESKMPEMIWVTKDGEKKYYALTDVKSSKIIHVEDNDNPGEYLAFPIYQPKDSALIELLS